MLEYDIGDKKVLEIGCGIALASHVLNDRNIDITATDYHPEVEKFLDLNSKLNDQKDITFVRTNWADLTSSLEQYDIIIGSDILYESTHAKLLSDFINRYAKPSCEVIIVDPGRKHHAKFSKLMENLDYIYSRSKPKNTDYLEKEFKGTIHHYLREANLI